jgi:peptidoglycan/LPS O-acetylase OafA/YrhL
MIAPRHRIGYIDGLRAIAVLAVVVAHSVAPGLGQSFGVMLFFVISGFCLSYPTLAKLQDHGAADFAVYRYAAHRVVRILPPYYIAIALLFGCAFFVPGLTRVSTLDMVRQALFLDWHTALLTGPFWSLPVEFRWYFLFPIGLWLWTRSPRAFFTTMFVVVVAAQATRATSVDLVALPAFLSGIVAAQLRVRHNQLARFALPLCIIMLVVAFLKSGTNVNPAWEAAVFFLVVAAGAVPWFSRVLSMKWLTSIGLVSYSIYLIHAPVIQLAEIRGAKPAVAAIIGIAAGYVFWYVAERPFLDGPLRARLISEFEIVFAKWFPRLGIGGQMRLSGVVASRALSATPEPVHVRS